MTFAILGTCKDSGQAGIALTTSSIAVGARCPFVRAGVGAVATQNVTDPRLGPRMLDAMAAGAAPAEAIDALMSEANIQHRQLLAIDLSGRTAAFSGTETLGVYALSEGANCVAGGNLLANTDVPAAMTAAFAGASGELAERLLTALAAGLNAGGEAGDIHSAALKIAEKEAWPYVDLRVDWMIGDPVSELSGLWAEYAPQAADYVTRELDPSTAPSYGVPGDE